MSAMNELRTERGLPCDSPESCDTWEHWLERHGPSLVLFARQYAPAQTDAEDIVHEGFVRFWQSRERAEKPDAYLFACVKRAALNFLRSSKRRKIHERRAEELFERSHGAAADERGSAGSQDALHAALARLPVEQREILVLKICSDLTFPQIAEVLEISPNTAASRHRYALEALRRTLVKEGPVK